MNRRNRKLVDASDILGAQANSRRFATKLDILDRRSDPCAPVYQYPGAKELREIINKSPGNRVEANYGRQYRPNRGSYIGKESSL